LESKENTNYSQTIQFRNDLFLWGVTMEESHEKLITSNEILELSLKMEREGQAFYKGLSQYIQDPLIKTFLQKMHTEEIQHEKLFRIMLEEKGEKNYGWEDKKQLHDFINEHFKTDIFPPLDDIIQEDSKFESLQKAVDFAVEAEMVAAEFYSLLGEFCEDLEAKTSILLLEQAENEHVKQVLTIKDKLLKQK
jgi:rubrerythrin